jgi:hypothetical protein
MVDERVGNYRLDADENLSCFIYGKAAPLVQSRIRR